MENKNVQGKGNKVAATQLIDKETKDVIERSIAKLYKKMVEDKNHKCAWFEGLVFEAAGVKMRLNVHYGYLSDNPENIMIVHSELEIKMDNGHYTRVKTININGDNLRNTIDVIEALIMCGVAENINDNYKWRIDLACDKCQAELPY